MVANPPGYYLASGNPSIAVPDGDMDTLLTVARKYNAHYLVLEAGSVPAGLLPVYADPQGQSDLIYLSEIGRTRVFLFRQRLKPATCFVTHRAWSLNNGFSLKKQFYVKWMCK